MTTACRKQAFLFERLDTQSMPPTRIEDSYTALRDTAKDASPLFVANSPVPSGTEVFEDRPSSAYTKSRYASKFPGSRRRSSFRFAMAGAPTLRRGDGEQVKQSLRRKGRSFIRT